MVGSPNQPAFWKDVVVRLVCGCDYFSFVDAEPDHSENAFDGVGGGERWQMGAPEVGKRHSEVGILRNDQLARSREQLCGKSGHS